VYNCGAQYTAVNSSDNLPHHVILQTIITAQMMSIAGQGGDFLFNCVMVWSVL